MLLDALGIAVGFATVMLLLSLIVTAIVQLLQHVLALRARNLVIGLRTILQEELFLPTPASPAVDDSANLVEGLLKHADPLRQRLPWIVRRMTGDAVTWLEPEELRAGLAALVPAAPATLDRIEGRFARAQRHLSSHFVGQVRLVTAVVGVGIALLFQVSAPELLVQLRDDPELRRLAEQQGELLLKEGRPSSEIRGYETVAEAALVRLAANHPDLATALEEASGEGDSRSLIIDEIAHVLDDLPAEKVEAIQSEYADLLDGLAREEIKKDVAEINARVGGLAVLGIYPWRHGMAWYTRADARWQNWIGVLVTALFLSFGAPFWFEVLQRSAGLRDALKPKPQRRSADDTASTQDGTTK